MCAAIDSIQGRARRFVQLWTLKEAYVKALGQGISASPGLKRFSIHLHTDDEIAHKTQQVTAARVADTAYRIGFVAEHACNDDKWGFLLLNLADKHTASLCVQMPTQPQLLTRLDSSSSDASTCTTYSASVSDPMQMNESASQEQTQHHVNVVLRSTVPLIQDDVYHTCHVQGAGGLWRN